MKIPPYWERWMGWLISPKVSSEHNELLSQYKTKLPVLWLMGKTGSGKSSIIQRLTGDSQVQIGSGFEPCTSGSIFYDYPVDMPVMRFLDTRGLGEAAYDPEQDLAIARNGSHALIIVTRVDDPSQTEICQALERLSLKSDQIAVLHVHSALHAVDELQIERAKWHSENQIEAALGYPVSSVSIDFTDPADGFVDPNLGIEDLRKAIMDLVPDLATILAQQTSADEEVKAFLSRRNKILGYCGATAAVDLVPAVGLIAVPSMQGRMLYALASHYGIKWDRRIAAEFFALLGSMFFYRYVWSLAGRQLLKFVPVYGQSAGSAAAASISFASTYALGRTVCLYLYRRKHSQTLNPEELRSAFRRAFEEQR